MGTLPNAPASCAQPDFSASIGFARCPDCEQETLRFGVCVNTVCLSHLLDATDRYLQRREARRKRIEAAASIAAPEAETAGWKKTIGWAQTTGQLSELLFAARNLAQSRVVDDRWAGNWGRRAESRQVCEECRASGPSGLLVHRATCHAGRVLRLVDKLTNTSQVPTISKTEKENAREEESARAGAGTPLRPGINVRLAVSGHYCLACKKWDQDWTSEGGPAAAAQAQHLQLNQRVKLFTHNCNAGAIE